MCTVKWSASPNSIFHFFPPKLKLLKLCDFSGYCLWFLTVGSGFIRHWQGSGRSGVLINMIGHEPAGCVLILMVVLIRAGPSAAVERISDCFISETETWFIALNVCQPASHVSSLPSNGGRWKQRNETSQYKWCWGWQGKQIHSKKVNKSRETKKKEAKDLILLFLLLVLVSSACVLYLCTIKVPQL